jgi:hypothetical protein
MHQSIAINEEIIKNPFANSCFADGYDIDCEFTNSKIAERIKGTQFDTNGQVFLVDIKVLADELGEKWEIKKNIVYEHLFQSFERKHPKPDWCERVNEFAFLFVLSSLLPKAGARASHEIIIETYEFFIGANKLIDLPVYEVIVDFATKLTIRKINPLYYNNIIVDKNVSNNENISANARNKNFNEVTTKSPLALPQSEESKLRDSLGEKNTSKNGQKLGVRTSLETILQIKNMQPIGHRLRRVVFDMVNNAPLNQKSISALPQSDCELIDKLSVTSAMNLISELAREKRRILIVIPISFLTIANINLRNKIIADLVKFSAQNGLKAICELHEINNVPQFRLLEHISYLKSQNIGIVCDNIVDLVTRTSLKQARVDGFSIEYNRNLRNKEDVISHIKAMNHLTKANHSFFYMYNIENPSELEIAKLAGFNFVAMGRK